MYWTPEQIAADPAAFVVEPGWTHADIITRRPLESFRLLTYDDGTVRFEHRCDRGERGVIICAPALCVGPHASGPLGTHTLTRNDTRTRECPEGQPTVRASVLCPDCGTHGFITDGGWYDC